jgi:hypothetical protein
VENFLLALMRYAAYLSSEITPASLINQIRAFLLERGIVFAKSPIRLREAILVIAISGAIPYKTPLCA